jgi:hypothetical protein
MDTTPQSGSSTEHSVSWEIYVDHYARMAMMSGAIDHARHQVKLMELDPTRQWIGLGKAVADRIKELKNAVRRD